MRCRECYSDNPRITPILKPEHCLENHLQYICSTCGRCICIDKDDKRDVYRWSFPFKTLEFAKLYLRTAEYLLKNRDKSCKYMKPVYISKEYFESPNAQIRKLNKQEIEDYLKEQMQFKK